MIQSTDPQAQIVTLLPNKSNASSVYRWSIPQLIRACRQSDLIVWGGGSVWQDISSSRSFYYYLGLLLLAQIYQKPVLALGQGLTALKGKWHQHLLRYFLSRPQVKLTVRDQASADLAKLWGITSELAADLAFYKAQLSSPPSSPSTDLGICVRPGAQDCLDDLRTLTEYSQQYFIADAQEDAELSHSLAKRPAIPIKSIAKHAPKLLISMRYHACIRAALAGIPFVAIVNQDPKLRDLAKSLDQEWIDYDEANRRPLKELIDKCLDQAPKYQSKLAKITAKLCNDAKINQKALESWINAA